MTESNVKTIFGGGNFAEPDQDTIERLEKLLADAKAGTIAGICYSCFSDSGHVVYGKAGFASHTMLSGLEVAKANLVDELRKTQ